MTSVLVFVMKRSSANMAVHSLVFLSLSGSMHCSEWILVMKFGWGSGKSVSGGHDELGCRKGDILKAERWHLRWNLKPDGERWYGRGFKESKEGF